MEERINQGFKIIQSITVGNSEFVLGENMKCPGKFVTWQCRDGTDYFWGHYISGRLYAVKDLYERALLETDNLIYRMEQREAGEQEQKQGNRNKKKDRER